MSVRSVGALVVAAILTVGTAGGVRGNRTELAAGAGPGAVAAATQPADGGEPPSPPTLLPPRRVDVAMEEYAFVPAEVDVTPGETVTFVFKNNGKAVHDAFVGDKAAQEEHARQMSAGKGHDHAHAGGVTVAPGETGAIRYYFDKPGTLEIGCHQPGHYKLGMIAIINVGPALPSGPTAV